MTRNELRKIKRAQLREAGFTSKEADRRRDWTDKRVKRAIASKVGAARKVRFASRTERQQKSIEYGIRYNAGWKKRKQEYKQIVEDYEDFSSTEREQLDRDLHRITRASRHDWFVKWTKAKEFPDWAHQWIANVNADQGFDSEASYGYRVFFYWYVEGEDFKQAAKDGEYDNSERRAS